MIGVDFDNTIVRYDDVFGRVALDLDLVPPHAATSKTSVRDHLRSIGQEDRWTELQGIIYGPRMIADTPGAIVSHRTRFPYLGERHDLHAAARDFLARHGFHDEAGIGLPVDRVFFEETKEGKLARIASIGCTTFVDDLPELLADPRFPAGVRRILFDPGRLHEPPLGVEAAASWADVARLLEDAAS